MSKIFLDLKKSKVDLFISKAAEEVLVMYKKKGKVSKSVKVYQDNSASSASVGNFYKGTYHTLVMAPTSSNTVAKCVYGISDTLATNIFAQSGKCNVNCIFFPCDTAPELKTMAPGGLVDVFPRAIDLENVEKLKKFSITINKSPIQSIHCVAPFTFFKIHHLHKITRATYIRFCCKYSPITKQSHSINIRRHHPVR